MNGIFNEVFWILIAFGVLIICIFKPMKNMVLKQLNDKIKKIEDDMVEVLDSKIRVYKALEELKFEYEKTVKDSKIIVEKASEEGAAIIEDAEEKILKLMKHSQVLAEEYKKNEERILFSKFKNEILFTLIAFAEENAEKNTSKKKKMGILDKNTKTFKKIWH